MDWDARLSSKEWVITADWLVQEKLAANESLFTLANGYLGVRGALEENSFSYHVGSYINGFYDSKPMEYEETAFGLAKNSQTMLNVPDGRSITFYLDDEPFDLVTGTMLRYRRALDLRKGILLRETEWKSPSGKSVIVTSERVVPFRMPHIFAIRYAIRPLQEGTRLRIVSLLDGTVRNIAAGDDPRSGSRLTGDTFRPFGGWADPDSGRGGMRVRTKNSGLALFTAVSHTWSGMTEKPGRCSYENQRIHFELDGPAHAEQPFEMVKFVSYHSGNAGDEEFLETRGIAELDAAEKAGFDSICREQESFLDDFWSRADIILEGDPKVQQSVRFNLFHIMQSVGKDGLTSIAAKGLTGEGYEGHYFWDTEIYVLPFLIYTEPAIARKLLMYRHSILPKARARALELSQHGALYPWRTINGEEASAYFLAGTAQYHINADIAYGIKKYLQVTGDTSFLPYATEMLVETARFWVDLGDYIGRMGNAFCINGVTGPDEYTALVNNNYYTNLMAQDNLRFAVEAVSQLLQQDSEVFKTIARELSFVIQETENWKKAAEAMYLPWDEELGIHPQDDSFLRKAVWHPGEVAPEKRPILLHYHPLVIYRFQILKQSDLILAEFLQGDHFSQAQKRRDFDYYDPLTTSDSSLSPCIQGVMATEIGYIDKGYDYFMRTARIDLDDLNGNVRDGIHTAAMAGTWISLVYGFAGLRDYGGVLRFRPRLPKQWERLSFCLGTKGTTLRVSITHDETEYRVESGDGATIIHEGTPVVVRPGAPSVVSLRPILRGAVFDLDGVITDTAEFHYQAWATLCKKQKIPFDREFNRKLKGVSRMESLELILSRAAKQYSAEEKIAMANWKNDIYHDLIRRITPDDILPGVMDFLQALKRENVRLALASASHNAATIIRLLNLDTIFDSVIDPGTIGKGKPDPEQFLAAADTLNVPYRNCVGIEDSQVGIDAIRSAGFFAVGIGTYLHGADWICADTSELSFDELTRRFAARENGI